MEVLTPGLVRRRQQRHQNGVKNDSNEPIEFQHNLETNLRKLSQIGTTLAHARQDNKGSGVTYCKLQKKHH